MEILRSQCVEIMEQAGGGNRRREEDFMLRRTASMNRSVSWIEVAVVLATMLFPAPLVRAAEGRPLVGIPRHGESAFEFLGRSDQDGPTVTHYGYLTHLFGLADAALFSDPTTRTEATARFTFSATTTLTARHEVGNMIVTAAPGTLTIYFNDTPGSDFAQPGSFAAGQAIATFSVRYHNILNVQAPNEGIATAVADLVQPSASAFTLNGGPHRVGHQGFQLRVRATGPGTRTQVDPVRAFFLLGAQAVVP